MASLSTLSMLLLTAALATAAEQDLPKRSGPADIDLAEPKLMLNDVPEGALPGEVNTEGSPPGDVTKLEVALERAKKNAAFRERLWKAGVLSKLEAEQGEMKVVRLTKDLENARLEAAKHAAEELHKQPAADDAAKSALAQADARVATASAAAQDAATKWEQAQLAAAQLRVQRERKVLALGAGSKSAVRQAEAALQKLIAAPAPDSQSAKPVSQPQ